MKIPYIITLVFLSSFSLAQTRQLELDYMKGLFESGEINLERYQELSKEWRELNEEIGGYPQLPYDENTGRIVYDVGIKEYDFNKEIIYKRIKEWAAITFGSLDAVLHYEDFESGKIILKGNFEFLIPQDNKWLFGEYESIDLARCYQIFIFTVKDNKLKLNITGIEFEVQYKLGIGNLGEVRQSIHSIYPITQGRPVTWKGKLSVLTGLNYRINTMADNMDYYIRSYNQDYDF